MEVAGPLGTPLGLAQRKRASPRGEAGTSGFLSVSDSAHPWDSPGKITGVGCHAFLQGIFWTQGLNPCLLYAPGEAWMPPVNSQPELSRLQGPAQAGRHCTRVTSDQADAQ